MYSKNSYQCDITIFDDALFFQTLYLTTLSNINKYSLVYMYHHELYPNILFTADSDLHFFNGKVNLKDNSIVTAPHHGSATNDSAYEKIEGKDLTFVRSDRSQEKRPGNGYLKNKKKYCTVCRNKTQKNKILLTFSSSGFTTTATSCIC